MHKVVFGILFGIFLTLGSTFIYRTYCLKDYLASPVDLSIVKVDSSKGYIDKKILEQDVFNSTFAEKLESTNKRLDDFLVFGGIIITLMLAISVSVYLRTEAEVNKHFKDNFEDYEKKVINATEEIEKLLSEAQSNAKIVESYKDKAKEKDKTTS